MNWYTSGDVWSISSSGQCVNLTGSDVTNGNILTQQGCSNASPQQWIVQPGVTPGSFFARWVGNASKCMSVRDPYNPSDPHWIHIWDCYSNHPAQQWTPVG